METDFSVRAPLLPAVEGGVNQKWGLNRGADHSQVAPLKPGHAHGGEFTHHPTGRRSQGTGRGASPPPKASRVSPLAGLTFTSPFLHRGWAPSGNAGPAHRLFDFLPGGELYTQRLQSDHSPGYVTGQALRTCPRHGLDVTTAPGPGSIKAGRRTCPSAESCRDRVGMRMASAIPGPQATGLGPSLRQEHGLHPESPHAPHISQPRLTGRAPGLAAAPPLLEQPDKLPFVDGAQPEPARIPASPRGRQLSALSWGHTKLV